MTTSPIVDHLREQLKNALEARTGIIHRARRGGREELNADESAEFETLNRDIAMLAERVGELEADEQRATNSASAFSRAGISSAARVTSEPVMYDERGEHSYFADMAKFRNFGDGAALTRLQRHAQETEYQIQRNERPDAQEQRDLSRVDGAGGYFVPPAWLMDLYAPLARAGRPTANLVTTLPLPPGTDSINIPLISTGTATAIQTADNAAVQETDMADSTVAAGVKTIAGQQDVAIQALEQSPVAFDRIILEDLAADLATKLDVQVLSGSNANNQVKGIFGATGTNAITYTDTTPTVGELYSKIASAANTIATSRYLAPTVIVMHPRRWYWFLAALDSSQRPLVVPNTQGPTNALGTFGPNNVEGAVGELLGLPVIVDANIPTTIGAATNEDKIIVMRASDVLLFESGVRSRVLPDVGSGTLTVRLQLYGYIAMTAERYPAAISIISGTGLTAPVL